MILRLSQVLGAVASIFSCSESPTYNDYSALFETVWILTDRSKDSIDPCRIGLTFHGDSIISIYDRWYSNDGIFTLTNNKIQLKQGEDTVVYTILDLSGDSLSLFFDGDTSKYYNRQLEHDPNLSYRQITLVAGPCFGECPVFTVKFDNQGQAQFYGVQNTSIVGKRQFNFDEEIIDKIDSLFKWSNILKLDSSSFCYFIEDGWVLTISFELDTGESKTVRGMYTSMPFRLDGIIGEILNNLARRKLIF